MHHYAIALFVFAFFNLKQATYSHAKPTIADSSNGHNTDTKAISYLDLNDFIKEANQQESNLGALYKKKGTHDLFYIKFPSSRLMAKTEVLAAALYTLAGVKVPEIALIKDPEGNLGVASKSVATFKPARDPSTAQLRTDVDWYKLPGIQEGFAADAWLGNCDVVGVDYHNMGTYTNPDTKQLEAIRVNTGGALIFKDNGEIKKEFLDIEVKEINTLRIKAYHRQAADLFEKVSKESIEKGISKIIKIDNNDIQALVDKYVGIPADPAINKLLYDKIIARKNNLEAQLTSKSIQTIDDILQDNLLLKLLHTDQLNALTTEIASNPEQPRLYNYGPLKKNKETLLFESIIEDIIEDKADTKRVVFYENFTAQGQRGTITIDHNRKLYNLHHLLNQVNFTHLSWWSKGHIVAIYTDMVIKQEFETFKELKKRLVDLQDCVSLLAPYWPQEWMHNILDQIELYKMYGNQSENGLRAYLLHSLDKHDPCIIRQYIISVLNDLQVQLDLLLRQAYDCSRIAYTNHLLNKDKRSEKEDLELKLLLKLHEILRNHSFIPSYKDFKQAIEKRIRENKMIENKEEMQDALSKLAYGEMVAIYKYTGISRYDDIKKLLSKQMTQNRDYDNLLLDIAIAAQALHKLPMLTLPYVIRSQSNDNDSLKLLMNHAKKHTVTADNTFISTSYTTVNDFAKDPDKNVKIIYKNIRGLYVAPFSQYPSEQEYLIPPSTQVKWTGYKKTNIGYLFTAEGANVLLND